MGNRAGSAGWPVLPEADVPLLGERAAVLSGAELWSSLGALFSLSKLGGPERGKGTPEHGRPVQTPRPDSGAQPRTRAQQSEGRSRGQLSSPRRVSVQGRLSAPHWGHKGRAGPGCGSESADLFSAELLLQAADLQEFRRSCVPLDGITCPSLCSPGVPGTVCPARDDQCTTQLCPDTRWPTIPTTLDRVTHSALDSSGPGSPRKRQRAGYPHVQARHTPYHLTYRAIRHVILVCTGKAEHRCRGPSRSARNWMRELGRGP